MCDTSRCESTLELWLQVLRKIQVLPVLFPDLSRVDSNTLRQLLQVVVMTVQVAFLAIQVNFKLLLTLRRQNLIDSSRDDEADIKNVLELFLGVRLEDLLLNDGGVESVLQPADHLRLQHVRHSGSDDESTFESTF